MESAGLWIQLCSPLFEPSTLYEVSLSACDEAVGVCQDITSIPISTAQLQGASIEFIDSIAKLTCFYVENIPLTNDTCDFTFFFLDGSELLFSIPRNSASNSALFETPNTREGYLNFVARYGSDTVSPLVTDIDNGLLYALVYRQASGESSQLYLRCNISSTSDGMGCLFVLSDSTGAVTETVSLLPELGVNQREANGPESPEQTVRCVESATAPTRFQVFLLYEGGIVSSLAVDGGPVYEDGESRCPPLPSPTTVTITEPVPVPATAVCTTATTEPVAYTTTVTESVCPTPTSETPPGDNREMESCTDNSAVLTGGVGGVLGLIIVIQSVVIVILLMRKRSAAASGREVVKISTNTAYGMVRVREDPEYEVMELPHSQHL
jgi:hypothetical protein